MRNFVECLLWGQPWPHTLQGNQKVEWLLAPKEPWVQLGTKSKRAQSEECLCSAALRRVAAW